MLLKVIVLETRCFVKVSPWNLEGQGPKENQVYPLVATAANYRHRIPGTQRWFLDVSGSSSPHFIASQSSSRCRGNFLSMNFQMGGEYSKWDKCFCGCKNTVSWVAWAHLMIASEKSRVGGITCRWRHPQWCERCLDLVVNWHNCAHVDRTRVFQKSFLSRQVLPTPRCAILVKYVRENYYLSEFD